MVKCRFELCVGRDYSSALQAASEDELSAILSSQDESGSYFTAHTLAGDTVQLCLGGEEKKVT